jgi:phosphohistidine phosphatase
MADRDRPLAPRGRRAAALMAAEIERRGLHADRILCSPARRTRETLAALIPHLAGEARISITAGLYEPPSGTYAEIIAARGADAENLLVIGHNPALQATAVLFAGGPAKLKAEVGAKLPAGALVAIEFPAGPWADIKPGTGTIALFLKPSDLESGEADD